VPGLQQRTAPADLGIDSGLPETNLRQHWAQFEVIADDLGERLINTLD
jgi:hypothetical protein